MRNSLLVFYWSKEESSFLAEKYLKRAGKRKAEKEKRAFKSKPRRIFQVKTKLGETDFKTTRRRK